jgi:uncharacterized HAD superfamily protein
MKNFILELDGCVCYLQKSGKSMTRNDTLEAKVVLGAKEWVNNKYAEGHTICFFTARPETLRRATETWLRKNGIRYHSLVMNKPNAASYHYIDDRRVQATTFMGKFTPLITKEEKIEVFG